MKKLLILSLLLSVILSCKEKTTIETATPLCDAPALSDSDLLVAQLPSGIMQRSAAMISPTIKIVFHVLWHLPEQNISDAQIQSQVTALNEAFNASNADTAKVPAPFKPLIGNAHIHFVIDKIIRKQTAKLSFTSDGYVCYNYAGGDTTAGNKYLNVWICNKAGAAGYSSYPWSGGTVTDGIIIGYNYTGTPPGTFTYNWSYLKGRTLVHEVGHWLGLIHTWGDGSCANDLVFDTPTQATANGSCPAFPHISFCNTFPGDMFMNYMDYTQDDCRLMFSKGQVTRMLGYLSIAPRSALIN